MPEGKDKAALLVAALPPPDKLGKGDSGGVPAPSFEAQKSMDVAHEAKAVALGEFDAAAPGSPERVQAFEDAVYACVMKLRDEGVI